MNFSNLISVRAPGSGFATVNGEERNTSSGINFYGDTGDSLYQVASDFAEWLGVGTNRANREHQAFENLLAREHQIKMAQNAYKWAVQDMKNAGLNPAMLYASGGNGASAPSGASGGANPSSKGSFFDVLGAFGQIMNQVNSARGLDLKAKELGMKNEQNSMTRRTSTQIYNSVGKIIKQVVSTRN